MKTFVKFSIQCALFCVALLIASSARGGLVVPRGGDFVRPGENTTIQWDTSFFMWRDSSVLSGNVSISLWNASTGAWTSIASSVAFSAASYTWSVSGSLSGSGFRIKVRSLADTNAFAISSSYFNISSTGGGLGKELVQRGKDIVAPEQPNDIVLTTSPNPFSNSQQVSFTIPDDVDAANITNVVVLDMMGRTVATLAKGQLSLGQHTCAFDGSALPSGQYMIAVHTAGHQQSSIVVLEK